jgi:hypothetical protein
MRAVVVGSCLLAAFLTGCNAEEQKKIDMQACSGYGFKPGTNEYAACMMQTAQNRAAQQAASQRQQSYNDTIAQQAQKDRDAQEQAQRDAQNAAHQAEIQNMMTSTSIPAVTTPTIPSIDTSNMHCTGQQGANAGSMSCTSN